MEGTSSPLRASSTAQAAAAAVLSLPPDPQTQTHASAVPEGEGKSSQTHVLALSEGVGKSSQTLAPAIPEGEGKSSQTHVLALPEGEGKSSQTRVLALPEGEGKSTQTHVPPLPEGAGKSCQTHVSPVPEGAGKSSEEPQADSVSDIETAASRGNEEGEGCGPAGLSEEGRGQSDVPVSESEVAEVETQKEGKEMEEEEGEKKVVEEIMAEEMKTGGSEEGVEGGGRRGQRESAEEHAKLPVIEEANGVREDAVERGGGEKMEVTSDGVPPTAVDGSTVREVTTPDADRYDARLNCIASVVIVLPTVCSDRPRLEPPLFIQLEPGTCHWFAHPPAIRADSSPSLPADMTMKEILQSLNYNLMASLSLQFPVRTSPDNFNTLRIK